MVVANRLGNWISTREQYCTLLRINARSFSILGTRPLEGGNILFLKEASVFNSPGFNRVKRLNSSTREF